MHTTGACYLHYATRIMADNVIIAAGIVSFTVNGIHKSMSFHDFSILYRLIQ